METNTYYTHDYSVEDERFEQSLKKLTLGNKVPKLNGEERRILEFCFKRNMKEFLKEEFTKHPIRLDSDGNLIGENPFDAERRKLGITEGYHCVDPLVEEINNF